jgi:hypothetical protein
LLLVQSPAGGTVLAVGTHTITYTITDAVGLTATCAYELTVADISAPVVTCPTGQNVTINGACSGVLGNYLGLAAAADNCTASAQLVLTYNIVNVLDKATPISTIAVHRKKQTNTIYTINAINKLIEANNNGILDKTYRINWEELKNTVLVTAYGKLKIVNTKLLNIINF